MKEEKHSRKKFRIIEAYSVLILIATLFMCVGYAQISGVELKIAGDVVASPQDGVFISEIIDLNESTTTSEINYYIGTMMDSKVILDNSNSTISYEVSVYNNSDKECIFIDAITDTTDGTLYDNENIAFTLSGIEKNVTTISPGQTLKFTITFKYADGADTSNNILNSKINFRFQEVPKLSLNKTTDVLENIYPDSIQEYTFTVSNSVITGDETQINNVPLKYYFDIVEIDSPLTAEIYDKNGKIVTQGTSIDNATSISISGDSQTAETHTYTLKIIWDNSKTEGYNSVDYANSDFGCKITLKAVPESDKYLKYELTKEFDIDITSAPFYFDTEISATSVNIDYDIGTINMIVKNYNTNNVNEFNLYDTTFEMSIENDNQFAIAVENNDNIITGGSAQDKTITLKFSPTEYAGLCTQKDVVLKIKATGPYVNEEKTVGTITINRELMLADLIKDGLAGNYLQQTYTVKDVNGTPITVPTWFKVTDTTYYVQDGVVMQDSKGSEFVWVPVDGVNVSYTKWSSFTNTGLPIENSQTSDDTLPTGVTSEDDQITKYKGFWIGRYEAGRPDITPSSADTNNSTSVELLIKKGAQPWNYISYTNAKSVAESYLSNDYVQSGLVTRRQWDTIALWAQNSGKDVYNDGSSWGMLSGTVGVTINGRYSLITDEMNSNPSAPQPWLTGQYTKSSWGGVFIGTGLNSNSQFKNIYDLVGNLWEWTTEVYNSNRIMRGSYASNSGAMLSYWEGNTNNLAMYSLGFRVVLYIK